MEIVWIDGQDTELLDAALTLARNVFWAQEAAEYEDEGVWEFDNYMEQGSIRSQLLQDRMRLWASREDQRITGVLALLPVRHISFLYVEQAHLQKGIARVLLQTAADWLVQAAGPGTLTANVFPRAEHIYQKLGFTRIAALQAVKGARFVPMRRSVP